MHIYSNYYVPHKSSTDSLPSEVPGKPKSSTLFFIYIYSPPFLFSASNILDEDRYTHENYNLQYHVCWGLWLNFGPS